MYYSKGIWALTHMERTHDMEKIYVIKGCLTRHPEMSGKLPCFTDIHIPEKQHTVLGTNIQTIKCIWEGEFMFILHNKNM